VARGRAGMKRETVRVRDGDMMELQNADERRGGRKREGGEMESGGKGDGSGRDCSRLARLP